MGVIYEPRGRAREYSPLALNLYTGCVHGCRYCFGPSVAKKTREKFHDEAQPRKDLLKKLERQCRKIQGDPREILLCFMTDPYQPTEWIRSPVFEKFLDEPPSSDPIDPDIPLLIRVPSITREALLVLERYKMKVQILTKGGTRACRDFDILARNGWSFGTTLAFIRHDSLREWEPGPSASIADRIKAIWEAKKAGIRTWLSMEPVICPDEALMLIGELRGLIDFWRIGKLNHFPEVEEKVDWAWFLREAKRRLVGEDYYIKKDLRRFEGCPEK